MQTDTSIVKLDINLIVPNKYQPRKVFDERTLNSLAESIKKYGILNPILVRKKEEKYEIIAGERRFRAAKQIGLTEVPVIVKDANEQQMAELALIENLERQNLSAIEEAKSYEEIMRIGNQTQESLAKKLGKSQSTIANKIRLLSLPIEIQEALAQQKISERHARSLINIKDKEKQLNLLNRIINEKLTVKETEQIINQKEFTEKEIKKAIDDIMKSLSMVEEPKEKEEKEDDNMNNGNFFPNFDNNTMNNNTSLNMMNMQSMNQPPMAPSDEMVMPTVEQPMQMAPTSVTSPMMPESNPIPDFSQFGGVPPMETTMQEPQLMVPEQPMSMATAPVTTPMMPESNPIPDFSQFGGVPPMETAMQEPQLMVPEQPMSMAPAPVTTPMMPESNPIPNFNQFGSVPPMEQQVTPQMVDTPLFNPEAVMPTMEQMIPEPVVPVENHGFDVPVVMPTANSMKAPVQTDFTPSHVDKISELKNYLSTNGYSFKSLGNENEQCIIIEFPKN